MVVCTTASIGFFSNKNIVIMTCRSGRHRSVANAELWSNTLTRCSRRQHSVSWLHLSELDFWGNTYARNCSECSKLSLRVFQERISLAGHSVPLHLSRSAPKFAKSSFVSLPSVFMFFTFCSFAFFRPSRRVPLYMRHDQLCFRFFFFFFFFQALHISLFAHMFF